MIERQDHGPVAKFKMARSLPGPITYHTSCYWVDGLLIDTGCAHCAREFLSAVSGLALERVVNTHAHEDHFGNNGALQRAGASISAHHLALPFLADPPSLRLHPYRHLFWGTPAASRAEPLGETVRSNRYTFRVIHTPGHSPDHICLYEEDEGWLFTGDAYVGGRDRALREEFDILAIIDSLKALAKLPCSRLFPASSSVVDKPAEALAAKLAYLEEAGEKVRELFAQGMGETQIRDSLFGPEMFIAYVTLGNFTGRHLVRSFLGKSHPGGLP